MELTLLEPAPFCGLAGPSQESCLAKMTAPCALDSEEVSYSACKLVIVGGMDVMPCALQGMDACAPNVRRHVLGLRERDDFVVRRVYHQRGGYDVR
jgi:hypothetical protein